MNPHYQNGYGARCDNYNGDGSLLAPYAEGDVVDIPGSCPAFPRRIPHAWSTRPELSQPGLYRVISSFSIGEGYDWYFRVAPIIFRRTIWDETSDRIHITAHEGAINWAQGWRLVKSADPDHADAALALYRHYFPEGHHAAP